MSEYVTGVKTFDGIRKIDYDALANKNHASQHIAGGDDPITPDGIGAISSSEKGAANGVATLDSSQKLMASQIPTITADNVGAIPFTEKGAANGVATLGTDGKVVSTQMPEIDYSSLTNLPNLTPSGIGAAPAYTYGTADLTAGSSALETGKLYFVYK